jgi:hypothetical protein
MKQKPRIRIGIRKASEEFNVDRSTLRRKLQAAYPDRSDNTYTLGEISRALCSPEEVEKARSAKARANLLEFRYQQKAAQLMPVEDFRDGVLDFTRVASEVISSLEAPEDLKRTLLRNIAGIKKSCQATVDQVLKDGAAREGRAS